MYFCIFLSLFIPFLCLDCLSPCSSVPGMSLYASFNAKFKWPLIGEDFSDFFIQPQTELIALASVLPKHFINNTAIFFGSIYLVSPLDYAIYEDRDCDWFFLLSHYPLQFLSYDRGLTKCVKWILIMAWVDTPQGYLFCWAGSGCCGYFPSVHCMLLPWRSSLSGGKYSYI